MERRHNWKDELGKEAVQRAEKRKGLMVDLEMNRQDLRSVNVKSNKYQELKLQQAEIIARLAVL